MESFRLFFEQTKEQEKNVKDTLGKLPKEFSSLIAGFKLKWHADNTLQGDDQHIGIINPKTKTITIAAPYYYGREFTFLHEIAHKVFEKYVSKESFKKWKEIIAKTKNKMHQSAEELWCMNFANFYAKNRILIHTHPTWLKYMKDFVENLKK